jgi:transposase
MRTAYKCRAYPNHEQVIVLNRTFGCVRAVWNRTLASPAPLPRRAREDELQPGQRVELV